MFIWDFLKFGFAVLVSKRGEGEENPGDGTPPAGQEGQPGEEKPPESQPPKENQPPKYGDFGDNPTVDDVFNAHQKLLTEHDTLKGKTTATERNAAALRKGLMTVSKQYGLTPVYDDRGNLIDFSVQKPEKKERTKRFTDDHVSKFNNFFTDAEGGKSFLEMLTLFVQDHAEEMFEKMFEDSFEPRFTSAYDKLSSGRIAQVRAKSSANTKMLKLFPSLQAKKSDGTDNPMFNQAFYDKATEIWKNTEQYKKAPDGELRAAIEAAIDLGIQPLAAAGAEKVGFNKGKQDKTILGPVDSKGTKQAPKTGKLTREEYLALSPEKKAEYDKASVGL